MDQDLCYLLYPANLKSLNHFTLPRENNATKAHLKLFIVIPSHTVAVVLILPKSHLGMNQ